MTIHPDRADAYLQHILEAIDRATAYAKKAGTLRPVVRAAFHSTWEDRPDERGTSAPASPEAPIGAWLEQEKVMS
jgi:hypothetical protein